MLNKFLKLSFREQLALVLVGMVCVALACIWCGPNGIVGLDGYDHAVALCEGGEDVPLHEDETYGKAHMWKADGILYVVNEGHLDDVEVTRLQEVAKAECAQYLEVK